MDDEMSLQQSADELIQMEVNLPEILGQNWKEEIIAPNIQAALEGTGITSLSQGEEVSLGEVKDGVDFLSTGFNKIFEKNRAPLRAKTFNNKDHQRQILIVGNIGPDTIYQIVREAFTLTPNDGVSEAEARNGYKWTVDKMGLVSQKTGRVLMLDKALRLGQNPNEERNMNVIEFQGGKLARNCFNRLVDPSGNSPPINEIETSFPDSVEMLGRFFHELAHLWRFGMIMRNPQVGAAAIAASSELSTMVKTVKPVVPEAKLTSYQTRKISAGEERGAWGLGISFIKTAGRLIGLDCASQQRIKKMIRVSEESLKSYDEIPYTFLQHDEAKPVPAFSQEKGKAVRQLHQKMVKEKISYSSLPNFDSMSGENLAKDPRKILEIFAGRGKAKVS